MSADKRLGELLDLVVAEGGSDLHLSVGGPRRVCRSGDKLGDALGIYLVPL